jgi:hypothetical protein
MSKFAITDLSINNVVEISDSDRLWRVDAIEKGWIALTEDNDGDTRKVRAKQVLNVYRENDSGSLELSAPSIPSEAILDVDAELVEELSETDDVEDRPHSTMASQIHKYASGYVKAKNASGTSTLITGDLLSEVSLYLDVPAYVATAMSLLGDSFNKYSHLNPGQQRMNYGNRIRASVKSGKLQLAVVVSAIGSASGVNLLTQYADRIAAAQSSIDARLDAKAEADGAKAAARELKAATKAEVKAAKKAKAVAA